jgi:hypothetical protein
MLLKCGPLNLQVSSSALLCKFQSSWAWNMPVMATCLSSRGVNLLFEQPYAASDRPAHQTWWFLVFEVLTIKKKSLQRIGAKRLGGWRDMQINVPFPLESTHLGYRCTTCAFSPVILYTGRLVSTWAHARVACKVGISLKLGWVQFDEVTCEKLQLSCKKEHVLAYAQITPSGKLWYVKETAYRPVILCSAQAWWYHLFKYCIL